MNQRTESSRALKRFAIRPIKKKDNAAVAELVRTVMPEFGASGAGFSIQDAEVDDMAGAYAGPRSVYFVVSDGKEIVGAGGIAPLKGGDRGTCELRKMYFLDKARGLGLGRRLLELCLAEARERGFRRCYLETLRAMVQARALYEKNGFKPLAKPMGRTGHCSCDRWYLRAL